MCSPSRWNEEADARIQLSSIKSDNKDLQKSNTFFKDIFHKDFFKLTWSYFKVVLMIHF